METTHYISDNNLIVNSRATAMQFAINKSTHWDGERYVVDTEQVSTIFSLFEDNMDLPDTTVTESKPL